MAERAGREWGLRMQPQAAQDAAQGVSEAFSYGGNLAPALQQAGAFDAWFLFMFAAMVDIQLESPVLTIVYLFCIVALGVLRTYFDHPIQFLGTTGIYIYTTIQAFSLFRQSSYVLDYTPAGWQVTAKSLWFAGLFTIIFVWGASRVLQGVVLAVMSSGLGPVLQYVNPFRLLDKLRKSDADLEKLEDGSDRDPKRQNTAIMFTDMVGFSKQMGSNEAAMLKKLQVHNEIMRGQIVRNRGTVIKTIGDAFMVRFRSAESAVQCALDCQKAIGEYNKTKTPEDQFHIRIGCHMGEVIHTTNDVFGDGVNIAARIEPKADTDGICVSEVIYNAAKNKVPAHFSSIGRQPMKNIATPPELFKVFPIAEQAPQKVQKVAAGAGAGAASAGQPGGTFKL
jgi:class 3 adenylate cyclase